MGECKNPTVKMSVLCLPVITSNFATDPDGTNMIEANILGLCKRVLDETMVKLMTISHAYCQGAGVELEEMNPEDQLKVIKESLEHIDLSTGVMHGVVQVGADGKATNVSFDSDLTSTVFGRRSTNN